MTLLTEPTRIVLAKGYDGFTDDADATAYLAAVQAADGQVLEPAVRLAVNSFVKGCKADGIWTAIKASCILAGARTLAGALVPLVGAAPTNFNFVSGDYNRKTGLVGDGSTKYLDSNRSANAELQNSRHLAVYATQAMSNNGIYIGAESTNNRNTIYGNSTTVATALMQTPPNDTTVAKSSATGLISASRSASNLTTWRVSSSTGTFSTSSVTDNTFGSIIVFARRDATIITHGNARLAFYSIGESLDLALLDTRVTDLINAFAAAIPVSLLLHGNGTNGSTTITDSSPTPKAVTAVGNAQISTAQSKFGGASIAFDGNGDYLSIPFSTDFQIAGDYTIEFWARIPAQSTASYTLGYLGTHAISGVSGFAIGHYLGNLSVRLNNVSTASSTTPLLVNTWQHIAVVCSGASLRGYVDGNQVLSGSSATTSNTNSLVIGNFQDLDPNRWFTGFIDDLRITKGIARYTSNFTPPTAPFPDF